MSLLQSYVFLFEFLALHPGPCRDRFVSHLEDMLQRLNHNISEKNNKIIKSNLKKSMSGKSGGSSIEEEVSDGAVAVFCS